MKYKVSKLLIVLILIQGSIAPVLAESLFKTSVSQNTYSYTPRSLYKSVQARNIGDLVTIVIEESATTSDDLTLDIGKTSSTTDNFRTLVNRILPGKLVPPEVDNFGGSNSVANQASTSRTSTFKDTITAQVVQKMPNGNLVVQGKKTKINAGEKVDIIVSGVIDPRLINNSGSISSTQVANLQLAFVGKGTVSRSDSEGTINKFIRYLY